MASKTSFLLLVIFALHSTTGTSIRSPDIEHQLQLNDVPQPKRPDTETARDFGGGDEIVTKDDELWEVNELEDAEWAFYQEMNKAGVDNSGAELRACNYEKFNEKNKYQHPMTYPPSTCVTKRRGVTETDIALILKLHNNLRDMVAEGEETLGAKGPQPKAGNMRELTWNDELATVAQAWADQCIWGHDNNSAICSRPYNVGQNIYRAWQFESSPSWELAILYWYEEVQNFNNTAVASFWPVGTGGLGVGHYTQLVWAKTHEIGCGAIYKEEDYEGDTYPWTRYYTCNYGPAGNLLGAPVYDPNGSCSEGKSTTYPNLCK